MSAEQNPANMRAAVDELIAQGAFESASRRLAELWRLDPASGTASFVIARLDQMRDQLALSKFKLAILRSFTVEPIVPLLRAQAFAYGIDLEVHVGDFNTYVQDMVDAQSSLYRFAPNAVVLAVRTESGCARVVERLLRPVVGIGAASCRAGDSKLSTMYQRISETQPGSADRSFDRAPISSASRDSRQPDRSRTIWTHKADQS